LPLLAAARTAGGQGNAVPGGALGSDEETSVQTGFPVAGSIVTRARPGLLFSAKADALRMSPAKMVTATAIRMPVLSAVAFEMSVAFAAMDFFPKNGAISAPISPLARDSHPALQEQRRNAGARCRRVGNFDGGAWPREEMRHSFMIFLCRPRRRLAGAGCSLVSDNN
jgi:hypothetical protein